MTRYKQSSPKTFQTSGLTSKICNISLYWRKFCGPAKILLTWVYRPLGGFLGRGLCKFRVFIVQMKYCILLHKISSIILLKNIAYFHYSLQYWYTDTDLDHFGSLLGGPRLDHGCLPQNVC